MSNVERAESPTSLRQDTEIKSASFVHIMKECPCTPYATGSSDQISQLEFNDPFFHATEGKTKGSTEEKKEFLTSAELKTGDKLQDDGKSAELSMPSGEKLTVSGHEWSLTDANGKEIANQTSAQGKLPDGAYMDHIVPIRGPGWTTINYPDGDSVSIRQGKVTVRRGDDTATFYAPNATPAKQRDGW
jgi:hypothetical protein